MVEHHAPGAPGQAIAKDSEVMDHWVWQEASSPKSPLDSFEVLSWICFMTDFALVGIS